ncbi:MAG: efflux RND transporter periplasmic adaptor subunit [Pseudomonadota bacterium]
MAANDSPRAGGLKEGRDLHIRNASLALLIAAATAVAIGCGDHPKPTTAPPIAVTVSVVRETAETHRGAYTANLQPYRQVGLTFQVSGYVETIKQVAGAGGRVRDIQGGDPVKSGELLATIQTGPYQQQVNQAASTVANAQATYAKAKADYSRNSELFKQKIIARRDYDSALQQFQSADAQVKQSEASLKQAQINLGYCRLMSPMDAVMLSRGIEIGSLVGPSVTAFQIADTTEMKAIFAVSDIEVGQLKQGQAQNLRSEALPGVLLEGQITRVGQSADPNTRTFDVEITVPNKDGRLRVGMIASLKLANNASAPIATAATVPINAIVRPPEDRSGYAVFVVTDEGGKTIARMRTVRLGNIVGNEIAVDSGVAVGDRVIVRGATLVTDGEEIRIIP